MGEIASRGQLRMSLLRWTLVTVPLVLLLGFASGRLAGSGAENRWFAALAQPSAMPPGWAFGAAWSLLYALMGIALAMILDARGARARGLAILAFVVQLALNLAWSPLFFTKHQVGAALILIVAIFVVALLTTIMFARLRPAAGWLMVPYLGWLCFAGALNWDIHRLNPNAETLAPSESGTQISL